jgi:hypothetical protein
VQAIKYEVSRLESSRCECHHAFNQCFMFKIICQEVQGGDFVALVYDLRLGTPPSRMG